MRYSLDNTTLRFIFSISSSKRVTLNFLTLNFNFKENDLTYQINKNMKLKNLYMYSYKLNKTIDKFELV